jgi:hypothetical protein
MRAYLPLSQKDLPLRCEGAVSVRDGWALCVKSHRSALFFLFLWAPARLVGLWGQNLRIMTDVLRVWDLLAETETVIGVLIFTPRDLRGRSYSIIHTDAGSLFVKTGSDVVNEIACDDLEKRLEAHGFKAYFPIYNRIEGQTKINFYPYLRPEYYNRIRFSAAQARRFSTALNDDMEIRYKTLRTVLEANPRHARARDIFRLPNVNAICAKLAQVPVAIGRSHGDLMSPNMLCRKDGRLPIIILDWESYEPNAPLVLDLVGAQDWAEVVRQANDSLELAASEAAEALIFMVIAGSRGFSPALNWLSQISDR